MSTILIAVATGVAVLLAGNWIAILGRWQLTQGAAVPWAIAPMALYLRAYWGFLGGGWGADGAATRRLYLRATRVSARLWLPSLTAGLAGFGGLLALLSLAARLVPLPAGPPIATPPGMPLVSVVLLLTMQSVIAGVTEEAAFRGYMQSMVERRYGLLVAIVVNGVAFGLLHFGNHPRDILLMLPYYVAVAAVYGGLTWAADSILPAVVLHVGGDMVVLIRWWATGRPEWQLTATAPRLVWETGIDGSFIVTSIALVALTVATVVAYRRVRSMRTALTSWT